MSHFGQRPMHVIGGDLTVGRRAGRIVVRRGDHVITSAPLVLISELVLHGSVQVTGAALHLLLDAGVPLVLLSRDGRARGRLEPAVSRGAQLRMRQVQRCADPQWSLSVSKAVAEGKIANQRTLLRRLAREHPESPVPSDVFQRTEGLEGRARQARSTAELRGIEGAAAAGYWTVLRPLLAPSGPWHRDRLAPDVPNQLVNYTSALLRETIAAAVAVCGLDSSLSCYHEPRRNRPTLVFDLMEEWRPVLLDSVVLALIGLRMVTARDLDAVNEGPRLNDAARHACLDRFFARLRSAAPVRPGETACTYDTRITVQVRQFAECVSTGAIYSPYRWR